MEKLVYLILSRDKDKFNVVYVGDCEKTNDKSFFVQHSQYKCWIQQAGSEQSLYLAILPLFEESKIYRQNILNKILSRYKPSCNSGDIPEVTPSYILRSSKDSDLKKFSCPCCGSEMKSEKVLEKSTMYRCTSCGLSDTKLNS